MTLTAVLWPQPLQAFPPAPFHTIYGDVRDEQGVLIPVTGAAIYCNNIRKADGSAVPGIVIPFSTIIEQGVNFFGWPLAAGDHVYTQSNFATKIASAGLVFKGYDGMDAYATGTVGASGPASSDANALSATPYAYLIPAGMDTMRAAAGRHQRHPLVDDQGPGHSAAEKPRWKSVLLEPVLHPGRQPE